jgi:hypothetical protein
LSGIILDGIHKYFKVIFPVYGFRPRYLGPLANTVTNPNSYEYKLTAIVLDIAGHRLVKPVGIKKDVIDKRSFLKLLFAKKGIDGNNLGNILHHKSVKSKFPPIQDDCCKFVFI